MAASASLMQRRVPSTLSPIERFCRLVELTTFPSENRLMAVQRVLMQAQRDALPVDFETLSRKCRLSQKACRQLEAVLRQPHGAEALRAVIREPKETIYVFLDRVRLAAQRLQRS